MNARIANAYGCANGCAETRGESESFAHPFFSDVQTVGMDEQKIEALSTEFAGLKFGMQA